MKNALSNMPRLLLVLALACLPFSASANDAPEDTPPPGTDEQVEPAAPGKPTSPTPPARPEKGETEKKIRLMPLKSMTFEQVKAILEPFMSPSGRIVYVSSRNAVMVYDTPEVLAQVQEILKEVDLPPVNIRVWITFDEATESRGAGVDVGTGGIVISTERGGEVDVSGDVFVTGGAHSSRGTSGTTQFLMTMNNEPARIWVGETVAHPVWVFNYGVHHGWWEQEIIYNDIGASLWIHPQAIGRDQIRVEVYPRLTLEGRNPLSVKAQELSTQVVVPNGGTIQLGGLNEEKRQAYRRLFGIGKVFNGKRLAITLRAEIVPARKPPE